MNVIWPSVYLSEMSSCFQYTGLAYLLLDFFSLSLFFFFFLMLLGVAFRDFSVGPVAKKKRLLFLMSVQKC